MPYHYHDTYSKLFNKDCNSFAMMLVKIFILTLTIHKEEKKSEFILSIAIKDLGIIKNIFPMQSIP